jgi:hypothetical protein
MDAFYCIIPGKPKSFQNRRKKFQEYKKKVIKHANVSKAKPINPVGDNHLVCRTIYFYEGLNTDLDVGSFAKGIQDALIGIVYRDDKQLETEHNSKFGLIIDSGSISGNTPEELMEAITNGKEFVYVEVFNRGDGLIKI